MLKYLRKKRPAAVAAAALLASTVAAAAIVAVVESNLVVNPEGTLTFVYPSTEPAQQTPGNATAVIVVDEKEGVVAPGIAVYTTDFRTGGVDYDGCVMATKVSADPADPTTTCAGEVDSGKRYKLRARKLNQPIDIVLSTDGQGGSMLTAVQDRRA